LFYRILAYIKFLIKSKNHHGVHSPFVFDLLTKCLYEKNVPKGLRKWEKYRKELLQNRNYIKVTDYGAGSKVFSSDQRQISRMAKHVGIGKKRAMLLLRLVDYFQFNTILELGTSLGLSTSTMALANPKAHITSLEGCKETSRIASQMFNKHGLKNIQIEIGNFEKTLSKALEQTAYDLIFFDGNHSKEATINYFKKCVSTAHNDSLFLFDDIHWSKEMEAAWEWIKEHEKVTVTVDTFQWGMVFFRKEQQKEHFTIRV